MRGSPLPSSWIIELLPRQSNHAPALTAVAEHQGAALLYLVDASSNVKSDAVSLATLRKQLANRSDPAWLGVLRLGSLEVFPIGFHEAADSVAVKIVEEQSPGGAAVLPEPRPPEHSKKTIV